jgi:hypothetical protein
MRRDPSQPGAELWAYPCGQNGCYRHRAIIPLFFGGGECGPQSGPHSPPSFFVFCRGGPDRRSHPSVRAPARTSKGTLAGCTAGSLARVFPRWLRLTWFGRDGAVKLPHPQDGTPADTRDRRRLFLMGIGGVKKAPCCLAAALCYTVLRVEPMIELSSIACGGTLSAEGIRKGKHE